MIESACMRLLITREMRWPARHADKNSSLPAGWFTVDAVTPLRVPRFGCARRPPFLSLPLLVWRSSQRSNRRYTGRQPSRRPRTPVVQNRRQRGRLTPLSKRWWPRRYRRRKRPSHMPIHSRVSFRCSDKDTVSQRTRQLNAQISPVIQRS
jgi:hypothetical protein